MRAWAHVQVTAEAAAANIRRRAERTTRAMIWTTLAMLVTLGGIGGLLAALYLAVAPALGAAGACAVIGAAALLIALAIHHAARRIAHAADA